MMWVNSYRMRITALKQRPIGVSKEGSQVIILSEPGMQMKWCWNTGCCTEKNVMRCSYKWGEMDDEMG